MITLMINALIYGFIIVGFALGLASIGNRISKFHSEGMARVAKYNTKSKGE